MIDMENIRHYITGKMIVYAAVAVLVYMMLNGLFNFLDTAINAARTM
jgi:hypothetical protein